VIGPALAFGPGDSSSDHTPSEHILPSEYGRGVGVVEEVLGGGGDGSRADSMAFPLTRPAVRAGGLV